MKTELIRENMVLELKKDRMEAYGMTSPLVIVNGFKYRKGYAVPWIVSNDGYFKPSDFARSLTGIEPTAIAEPDIERDRR